MTQVRTPGLTVIGTGYLGVTQAAAMASLGYGVLGVDVDIDKVAHLSAGHLPFYEPGLAELLRGSLATGRLRFTPSYEEAAEFGDVHLICVGTPQQPGGYAADLSYLDSAVRKLGPLLTRDCLVVGKSTVPAGTAARMRELLRRLAPAGAGIELAWSPEFLREGHAVEDALRPDRLVFGVATAEAERRLRALYAPLIAADVPVVVTDLATAELVKVAANAFLATKISFINAMADMCEVTGADVTLLARALALDPRIGDKFLNAGLGFGGGCLPKDIHAFIARADELGVGQAASLLRQVAEINLRRRDRVVDLARAVVGGDLAATTVAVLGGAFKPDSDDIRDSPALAVADRLRELGAAVCAYDPAAIDNARRRFPQLSYAAGAMQAASGADVVLLLTEWAEFIQLDPEELGQVVAHRRIVDGRNCLDPARWRAAGWEYRALGRP